jgi:hypothetical protein
MFVGFKISNNSFIEMFQAKKNFSCLKKVIKKDLNFLLNLKSLAWNLKSLWFYDLGLNFESFNRISKFLFLKRFPILV